MQRTVAALLQSSHTRGLKSSCSNNRASGEQTGGSGEKRHLVCVLGRLMSVLLILQLRETGLRGTDCD